MRASRIYLFTAGLLLALSSATQAHIGSQILPIYELSTVALPNLHDGTLQDWESVLPGASLDQNQFAPLNVGDGAGINPADLAYRVFMAWNQTDQRIYVAIERVDDHYVNTYAGGDLMSLWQFDGIEFMVDGDHSGGPYNGFSSNEYTAEEVKLLTDYQAQQYMAIATSPDGRTMEYLGSGQGWVSLPPYADAGGFAYGISPNTSVIELAVTPWDELNWRGPELSKASSLYADKIIGFQISIPDFDAGCASCSPGGYHGFYTILGQPNTWRLAENFVDGQLIPCAGAGCGGGPRIVLSATTLNFDNTRVGATSQKTFTISNTGPQDLVISGITTGGTDAAQFQVSPSTATIPPGGNQSITVTLTQGSGAESTATLSIAHNSYNSPTSVKLVSLRPAVRVSAGSVSGLRRAAVTVPISVAEAQGVAGGDLTLKYDANVLTAKQVKGTDLLTRAGITVVPNLATSGQAKVSMAGATGLASGDGVILQMTFEIRSTARIGNTPLTLQAKLVDVKGKFVSSVTESGAVMVMLPGDVNGDQEVGAGDAVLALRYSAGLITLSDAEKDIGDVNGDKALNSADAILILRYSAGIITKFPREGVAKLTDAPAPDAAIRMGEVRVRGAGSSEVPVVLESGVGGGDLLLHYDAEACRLAGIDAPEGVVLASNDRAGELRLSVARAEAAGPAVLRVGFTGSSLPSVELTGLVFGVEGERLSAVDSRLAQPKVWSLRGYPNPFNPAVTLRYELGEAGEVQLVIYDVSGAMVRRLVSGWQGAGGYAVVWDGRDEGAQAVASGLYLGCLESGSVRQVHKLMLLK